MVWTKFTNIRNNDILMSKYVAFINYVEIELLYCNLMVFYKI
jgi:hypothetical protein